MQAAAWREVDSSDAAAAAVRWQWRAVPEHAAAQEPAALGPRAEPTTALVAMASLKRSSSIRRRPRYHQADCREVRRQAPGDLHCLGLRVVASARATRTTHWYAQLTHLPDLWSPSLRDPPASKRWKALALATSRASSLETSLVALRPLCDILRRFPWTRCVNPRHIACTCVTKVDMQKATFGVRAAARVVELLASIGQCFE